MAAVAWEDFIQDLFPGMSEKGKLRSVTVIALVFGFISIAMAASAEPLGGILQTCLSVMGAIGGPICGLFILGMIFPQANRHGALIGLGASVLLTGWVAIGNVVTKPYEDYALDLPVDQCVERNLTSWNFTDYIHLNGSERPGGGGLKHMYTLSEVFFPALGIILVVIIGLPVSLLWKDNREEEEDWVAHEKQEYGVKPRLCITEFIRRKGDPPQPPAGEQHVHRKDDSDSNLDKEAEANPPKQRVHKRFKNSVESSV